MAPKPLLQCKILVVDDEPLLKTLINQKFKNKIKSKEFEFYFSAHGQDAIDQLHKNPEIELVLIDINMPGMDGFTLLDTLLKEERTYRLIMVTAYADMTNVRRAISKGASDFITKPIDLDDLDSTITRNLVSLSTLKELKNKENALHTMFQELEESLKICKTFSYPANPIEGAELYGKIFPEKSLETAFLDAYQKNAHQLCISFGVVEGKGIQASLFKIAICSLMHSFLLSHQSLSVFFGRIKNLISGKENKLSLSTSLFFGVLDLDSGLIRYIGSLPFLVFTKKGEIKDGTKEDTQNFEEKELLLEHGDILVLASKIEKFESIRFNDFLKENAHKPLNAIGIEVKNELLAGENSTIENSAIFLVRVIEREEGNR